MGVTEPAIGCGGAGRGLVCRLGAPNWGPIRGGEVQSDFFWKCGVFGYNCSCWHVISLAMVTQEGSGAKVNHPALWKHTQQSLQLREWAQRITWHTQRPFSFLRGQKNKPVSLSESKQNVQRAAPACYESNCSYITSLEWAKKEEANCSAGVGHSIVFPKQLKIHL